MKNHIKAIGLQFSFYAIWLIMGLISFLMMSNGSTNIKPLETFTIFIVLVLLVFIFIIINYIITVKACEFVEPLATSSFKKYVFAFLAYMGFYSVVEIFLPMPAPTENDLVFFTQKVQFFALLLCILLFTVSVFSYRIFNKKSGE